MNTNIRLIGLNGEQTGHFEEIAPDDWRGVDIERSAGICIYRRHDLITRLADLIGGGFARMRYVHRIETSHPARYVLLDQLGNTWLDDDYLAPHEYLPRLVPVHERSA